MTVSEKLMKILGPEKMKGKEAEVLDLVFAKSKFSAIDMLERDYDMSPIELLSQCQSDISEKRFKLMSAMDSFDMTNCYVKGYYEEFGFVNVIVNVTANKALRRGLKSFTSTGDLAIQIELHDKVAQEEEAQA